jgi:hypothetical protein
MSLDRIFKLVRIAVELASVAWVTAWGLNATTGPGRWLLATTGATGLLVAWGRYVAPRSPQRLHDPARLVAEIALFIIVTVMASDLVSPGVGIGFGVVATVDALGLRLLESHHGPSAQPSRPAIRERP